MITLFTIGFTKKSAEQFFELLKKNKVKQLVDVRISNGSQLAGFAKGKDLDESVRCAKDYISGALNAMLDLGKGSGPLDHAFNIN